MLTDTQIEHLADEAVKAYGDIADEMLIACIGSILALQGLTSAEIARESARLAVRLRAVRSQQAERAAKESLKRASIQHVASEYAAAGAKPVQGGSKALSALEAAQSELVRTLSEIPHAMASDVNARFLREATRAAIEARSGLKRRDIAIDEAVRRLAAQDITAYTYTDKNGREYKVAVDAGIRRHIETYANHMLTQQTLFIANETGCELVEVSSHPGARPSHNLWQGKVYSLHGDVPGYPNFGESCMFDVESGQPTDLVDGLHGYNCRHQAVIWREGTKRRWSDDPNKDAGVDNDEIYRLRGKQRAIEREIRGGKSEIARLEANGLDATDARRRLAARQRKMRAFIDEHGKPGVIFRERWREQVAGTGGKVHLTREQELRVERQKVINRFNVPTDSKARRR